MAELRDDAAICHICGTAIPKTRSSYSSADADDPTEVIPIRVNIRSTAGLGEPVVKIVTGEIVRPKLSAFDRSDSSPAQWEPDRAQREQLITDGRISARLEVSDPARFEPTFSSSVDPRHSGGAANSIPVDPRAHVEEPLVRPGPFAALISEALGLTLRAPSAVVPALELPDEVLIEDEHGELAPALEPASVRAGGRSQAEAEGWLDASFARPPSARAPVDPVFGSPQPRAIAIAVSPSDRAPPSAVAPPVAAAPPIAVAPRVAVGEAPLWVSDAPRLPLGPPPVRAENLPLNDPDRKVRQAAELIHAALEAIADNKIAAAKNHVKLALGFGANDPSYQGLAEYLIRLEANRDPAVDALEKRAAKLEADGQLDLAVNALREAIGRSEEPQLLERLGILIGVKQRRPEVALRFLERAVKLRPTSKGYARSLERVRKLVPGEPGDNVPKKPRTKKPK
ncbi:MAG: tetratricopeptide repeat protein [Deltaproteobacteria bacterium]|nr:tetratricopeptide repeat protein [Deltaproteobacteria bacterium]